MRILTFIYIFIFVFLILLVFVPSTVTPAYAQPSCTTFPRPQGCPCISIAGVMCQSGYCINGICSARPAPPAPPCTKFASDGKCLFVLTALGPVSTDTAGFVTKFLGVSIAASGAIALILMMRSGYKIMSARGSSEGIQQGREQFFAAIIGLLFIIFSLVILEVMAKDLLKIPGFALP